MLFIKKTSIDNLSEEVNKVLKVYGENIVKGTKASAKKAIQSMRKETKAQRFKEDTGKYRAAIATRRIHEDLWGATYRWYVKAPHYRLSHLLEHGHATTNGGRTKAYGFISKASENATKQFEKDVDEVIKNS